LVHLLLPADLDLDQGWLRVRNKPKLGWQVKTRNERDLPLIPALIEILHQVLGDRKSGPVFRQRRCSLGYEPPLAGQMLRQLEYEVACRLDRVPEDPTSQSLERIKRRAAAQSVWRDLGALKEDWLRKEFMSLTKSIGLENVTAPKTLRHTFATCLQDGNVDPLIRNELMGHAPMALTPSGGLGMTTVYTHTRPDTKRRQLDHALGALPAVEAARRRLAASRLAPPSLESTSLLSA
jgi:integrase